LDLANLNRFEQLKKQMIEKVISKNSREMGPKKKEQQKSPTVCEEPTVHENHHPDQKI